jgi:hypothetical protein
MRLFDFTQAEHFWGLCLPTLLALDSRFRDFTETRMRIFSEKAP